MNKPEKKPFVLWRIIGAFFDFLSAFDND